jgi:uncharacterized lipoprotein
MKKIVMGVLAVALLAGCGHSADTVSGNDGYQFHGHPIDCMETGIGNTHTLTCDFVGWHQKYDPAK